MAKKEEKFGDIIRDDTLEKRTLMVSAFPALIRAVQKDGDTLYEGFLPGFEFAEIKDVEDEDECVEYLQDMLDDEVEELVVFGKPLPDVEEDDELMEKYPDYHIVYLDINVYATKCSHDCSSCDGCEDYDYYDKDFDCYADDCGCGDPNCHCGDDCDCDENDNCGCHCGDDDCECDDECDDDCHDGCDCDDDCDCGCQDDDCDCGDDDCDCDDHSKKCNCGPDCTCGCQEGMPCTCGGKCK